MNHNESQDEKSHSNSNESLFGNGIATQDVEMVMEGGNQTGTYHNGEKHDTDHSKDKNNNINDVNDEPNVEELYGDGQEGIDQVGTPTGNQEQNGKTTHGGLTQQSPR